MKISFASALKIFKVGLLNGLVGEKSACNEEDETWFDPGSKILRRKDNPL